MIGDRIRRTGFWVLDALRGGKIRANYLDVKSRLTLGNPNLEQLIQLLQHAVDTTEFYKGCDPDEGVLKKSAA